MKGIEPSTFALGGRCSTIELHRLIWNPNCAFFFIICFYCFFEKLSIVGKSSHEGKKILVVILDSLIIMLPKIISSSLISYQSWVNFFWMIFYCIFNILLFHNILISFKNKCQYLQIISSNTCLFKLQYNVIILTKKLASIIQQMIVGLFCSDKFTI